MYMVNAYVGKPYKLVFPLLCNGYLNINYDDTVTVGSDGSSTTAISRLKPLWAHDGSFTLEAIITPYDVNGVASRTAGKDGILDSQKTPPYPDATNEGQASRFNNYESVNYLGYLNEHLTQKMMIFHNTNLKLYLENTTSSSYNQPAEYKVVAEITSGGVTKTIQTDTVIKATNRLIGYYDSSAYYDGHATSYRRLSTSASGSNPQGTVTVSDYSNLPVNVRATGEVAFSGVPAHYSSPVKATSTITIAGQANFKTDVFPAGSTSGYIKFGVVPDSATDSDTTEFIQITKEDGGEVTKWFAVDGATNNSALTGGNWPAGARAYTRSTDAEQIATNLAAAINAYDAGWAGSVSAGADPTDATQNPPSSSVLFTGGIVGSSPNRKGADGDITLGSGLPAGITRVQISGGANELIQGETTGHTSDANINYITITDSAGNARNYFPSHDSTNQPTGSTGTRTLDDSSTVSVRYFQWSSSGNNNNAASALNSAINASSGHGSTITATVSSNVITLTHDLTGTAGNSATLAKNNVADSVATISGSNFTGGVDEANATNTPYVELTDNESSPTTKKYVPVKNGDAISTGTSQTIGDVSGAVAFQEGANASDTADNLRTAIANSNGHNGTILTDSAGSATINLTQNKVGANTTAITLNNLASNISKTNFSGGATPDNFLGLTDASGTLKKYKASEHEVTGTTDGTYVFYRAETDNDTTAANLETAIDGTNGHNGTLITTRTNNALAVKLNQAAVGSSAVTENVTGLTATAFSTTQTNNVEVGSGEAENIGVGNKIYDSSTTLIGTVQSVSGDTITLDATPATAITSTIYTDQLKEALYVEQVYKVSLVYSKSTLELYLNEELVKKDSHTLTPFHLHHSDCKIGRGANNAEQFFGELFEIAMHKGKRPSSTQKTLTPGFSDILFYYTFGD